MTKKEKKYRVKEIMEEGIEERKTNQKETKKNE